MKLYKSFAKGLLLSILIAVAIILVERYRYSHPPQMCYIVGGNFSLITGWNC
jgi:hypothetical protein